MNRRERDKLRIAQAALARARKCLVADEEDFDCAFIGLDHAQRILLDLIGAPRPEVPR